VTEAIAETLDSPVALDKRVKPVYQEPLDYPEPLDSPVALDKQDKPVYLVKPEQLVVMAQQEGPDPLEYVVKPTMKETRAQPDALVKQDKPESQERLDQRV
jgi:hypothetical protein